MLLENTIRTHSRSDVKVFDLKGSFVDRKVSEDSLVLKDLNYRDWIRCLRIEPKPFQNIEITTLK